MILEDIDKSWEQSCFTKVVVRELNFRAKKINKMTKNLYSQIKT